MGGLKEVFLEVLNMSVTAGVAVVLVLGVRLLIQKASKSMAYLLWAVVGFRLLCPYSFPSEWSIFNLEIFQNHAVAEDTIVWNFTDLEAIREQSQAMQRSSGQNTYQQSGNGTKERGQMPDVMPESSQSTMLDNTPAAGSVEKGSGAGTLDLMQCLAIIWVAGMAVFLVYEAASYHRLRRRLAQAVKSGSHICECDSIEVPFVMGVIKPRIYLPFRMGEEERTYILLHEQYHIRRKDYLVKAGALLLLMVHWFNPLVWAAYHFMCEDMEMSCDEKVIAGLGQDVRCSYSNSLLSFAVPRRMAAGSRLAFGETSVKSRIKNVLSFKKPEKAVAFAAVVVCVFAAIFVTANAQQRSSLNYEGKVPLSPGTGFNLSYNVEKKMRSFLLYREVYKAGVQQEYEIVLSGEFGDEDQSFKRRGQVEILRTFKNEGLNGDNTILQWKADGEQGKDTVDIWKYGFRTVTENYLVGEETNKKEIEAEEDFVVAAWHLGIEGEDTQPVPCSEFDQRTRSKLVWNANDGEILYRMVVSELSINELLKKYEVSPQVKELFEAKNPYIGDAPANGKLLELLNAGGLGEFTMELQTSEEPYILMLHFKNEPADQTVFNRRMEENAVVLLALIENAGEIQWTYPVGTGDSATEFRWKYDCAEAEERMSVDNIKECAQTVTLLKEFLDKQKEPYVTYERIDISGGYYYAPDGTKYKYAMYLQGMMPNAQFGTTYNVLSNDENLSFDEVARSLYSSTFTGERDFYVVKEINKYESELEN